MSENGKSDDLWGCVPTGRRYHLDGQRYVEIGGKLLPLASMTREDIARINPTLETIKLTS